MSEEFLVTTSSEGLKPLGTPPQRSFELVSGTIEQRLGTAHAHLFAEPVTTNYGDRLDWYAPVSGKTRRLSDMDGEDAVRAQARLDELLGDIRELAQTVGASDDPEEQRLAEGLDNAIQIPGPEFVYIIDTGDADAPFQPVLVNWARTIDQQTSVRGALTGADRRPPPVPKAVPAAVAAAAVPAGAVAKPVNTRRSNFLLWPILWWLGWVLLGLLIAAILYLLIPACGLKGTPFWSFCRAPAALMSAENAETRRLEDQIAQLERQMAIADRACQPPPPPPPPAPVPEPIQLPDPEPRETDIDRALNRAGGQQGDLSFTLVWDSKVDLDLHVNCPSGQKIWFKKRAICRGKLDVDANARPARATTRPVENIFYEGPLPGNYRVTVNYFSKRTPDRPQSFTLQIRDGDNVKTLRGAVRPSNRNWTTNFVYRNN